jgi:hypothetical protein
MKNAKPASKRKRPMRGNVVNKRFLRPKVSMILIAGRAKTQLIIPNPQEAIRACASEKPDWVNMLLE